MESECVWENGEGGMGRTMRGNVSRRRKHAVKTTEEGANHESDLWGANAYMRREKEDGVEACEGTSADGGGIQSELQKKDRTMRGTYGERVRMGEGRRMEESNHERE